MNKQNLKKIIDWLDIKFAIVYFYTRRFFEHGIIRWIFEVIKKFYNLILSVLLLVFIISFIFFYIRHFLDLSFKNVFENFKLFCENNLGIYLYLIITVFLIGIKYIVEIIKFIFKYFINWTVFFTLFILYGIIYSSNEKSFLKDINYLTYLGYFYGILLIGLFLKFILLLDKKDSGKGYYFNFYKKTYDKIFKNNILEDKFLVLENKYINASNNIGFIYKVLNKIYEFFRFILNLFKIKIYNLEYLNKLEKKIDKLILDKNQTDLIINKRKKEKPKIKNGIIDQSGKWDLVFGTIFKQFLILEIFNIKNKINELYYGLYLNEINNFNIKRNFIEPISDEPIGIGNDIFGNEDFAKNIYDLLNGINFEKFRKSYSIGIVGEWGGGKSSIINLVDEQFLDGNPNFQVLKFNPWDYKKENLVNSFFGELSKILGVKDISSLLKKYLKLVGNISDNVSIGTDFLSGFIGGKSLEEIKNEIDEKLKNYGRKIVVIIDDLDRCEPDEVLMMLNLIKNLGDFNNIIYLVSYDKEHIIKVLENKKFSGDYIEKIINIERFIPIPGKEELKEYFKIEFTKILKNLKKGEKKLYSDKKIEEITDFLIKEFDEFFDKENLRFIKKLLNHLNIILQLNLEKNSDEMKDFNEKDYKNIFILNYIKLKDYKWFNFILEKIKRNEKLQRIDMEEIIIPRKYLYLTFIDIFGFGEFQGGGIGSIVNDKEYHIKAIKTLNKYT